jgi:dTDP-4-dehydrorhamnose reductase
VCSELLGLAGTTILISGADGMLGRAFREALSSVPCTIVALDRAALDVTDRAAVLKQADRSPDFILHCAANVDADACERDPDECRRVQVGGTANIVELATRCGAGVFYPQSVFIFDGQHLPVTEDTTPAPVFAYGRYKLEAERVILREVPGALVVRMAGFFGGDDKDKNFVGKFTRHLRAMRSRNERRYEVGSRVWQPTYTLDLARNTLLLLAMKCSGVYHMGAHGEASFFEVASACVHSLGLTDRIELVAAEPELALNELARRPGRMVTATERLDREGLNRQRPWREALHEYLGRPCFDDLRAW